MKNFATSSTEKNKVFNFTCDECGSQIASSYEEKVNTDTCGYCDNQFTNPFRIQVQFKLVANLHRVSYNPGNIAPEYFHPLAEESMEKLASALALHKGEKNYLGDDYHDTSINDTSQYTVSLDDTIERLETQSSLGEKTSRYVFFLIRGNDDHIYCAAGNEENSTMLRYEQLKEILDSILLK